MQSKYVIFENYVRESGKAGRGQYNVMKARKIDLKKI